jgi:hypothetical protein
MESQPQQQVTPILQVAWTRFAQLDASSNARSKAHMRLRRWIAALGVLATLFAILSTYFPYPANEGAPGYFVILGVTIRFLLILAPIAGSIIAAFTNKFFSSGDWLITRAGAEEILKEILAYRTILKNEPDRRQWLEKRLAEIQRSVFRGMNGELTMEPYEGPLPPYYNPEDPYSDPGFHDLTGEEYFRYRVEYQLGWHVDRINRRQAERTRLQWYILLAGGAGALLAAIVPLWAALAASFVAVFLGWQELRNLDAVVRNYSKVIMELNITFDHWKNLESAEQTDSEFYKMVRSSEDILWSQNVEYIKSMQEALKESDLDEEASLINRVIKEARDSDQRLKENMRDTIVEFTSEQLHAAEEKLGDEFKGALYSIAEEASSELVQAEFAAMQQAIAEKLGLSNVLENIKKEFAGVEIGRDTPASVLNEMLRRFPKTEEAKG